MGQSNLKAVVLSQESYVEQSDELQAEATIETLPTLMLQSSQALLLCSYRNPTNAFQIVRVMDDRAQLLLERVLCAGQTLEFWAQSDARLEVFSGEWTSSLMVDSIVCERLQVSAAAAAA